MPEKKPVKKAAAGARAKPAAAAKAKPAKAKPAKAKPVREVPATVKKPAVVGPTARTCPLVLDGEVDASDFSEKDCLTCGEFDCRFCESQGGSGSAQSRLFAGGEDGDEDGDEGWDLDFGEGEESGAGAEDGDGAEDGEL